MMPPLAQRTIARRNEGGNTDLSSTTVATRTETSERTSMNRQTSAPMEPKTGGGVYAFSQLDALPAEILSIILCGRRPDATRSDGDDDDSSNAVARWLDRAFYVPPMWRCMLAAVNRRWRSIVIQQGKRNVCALSAMGAARSAPSMKPLDPKLEPRLVRFMQGRTVCLSAVLGLVRHHRDAPVAKRVRAALLCMARLCTIDSYQVRCNKLAILVAYNTLETTRWALACLRQKVDPSTLPPLKEKPPPSWNDGSQLSLFFKEWDAQFQDTRSHETKLWDAWVDARDRHSYGLVSSLNAHERTPCFSSHGGRTYEDKCCVLLRIAQDAHAHIALEALAKGARRICRHSTLIGTPRSVLNDGDDAENAIACVRVLLNVCPRLPWFLKNRLWVSVGRACSTRIASVLIELEKPDRIEWLPDEPRARGASASACKSRSIDRCAGALAPPLPKPSHVDVLKRGPPLHRPGALTGRRSVSPRNATVATSVSIVRQPAENAAAPPKHQGEQQWIANRASAWRHVRVQSRWLKYAASRGDITLLDMLDHAGYPYALTLCSLTRSMAKTYGCAMHCLRATMNLPCVLCRARTIQRVAYVRSRRKRATL